MWKVERLLVNELVDNGLIGVGSVSHFLNRHVTNCLPVQCTITSTLIKRIEVSKNREHRLKFAFQTKWTFYTIPRTARRSILLFNYHFEHPFVVFSFVMEDHNNKQTLTTEPQGFHVVFAIFSLICNCKFISISSAFYFPVERTLVSYKIGSVERSRGLNLNTVYILYIKIPIFFHQLQAWVPGLTSSHWRSIENLREYGNLVNTTSLC